MQLTPKDAPRRFYLLSAFVALCATACGVGAVDNAASVTSSANTAQTPSQTGGDTPSTTQPTTTQPTTAANPNAAVSPTPGTTPPASPKTTGPATFTGTVQQTSLMPKSAIFAVVQGAGGSQTLAVKISDQADDCTQVTNNAHHSDSNSFWLRAVGPAFANAAFNLAPQNTDNTTSTATFYALDSACSDTLSTDASWATTGSVNFTTVSATAASGTFSATIGSQGDKVSGTFAATACPALATLITAPNTPRTCE